MRRPDTAEWQQLLELLDPVHDQAVLFARRIARSNSDGDDLFQEALMRAAIKLPGLRDPARFRPWFHQIIVSVHRSRARRSFWRRLVSSDAPEAADAVAAQVGEDGERAAEERAAAARAVRALATLPPAQREAIVLFELQGHSVEEIAEIQRTSLSSVKSRLAARASPPRPATLARRAPATRRAGGGRRGARRRLSPAISGGGRKWGGT